jgi:hypothetical protein
MRTFKLNNSEHHVNQYVNEKSEIISDLISYTTRVASYNHKTNKMQVFRTHSNTTRKHINLFLQFYGFDKCTKKEFEKCYGAKE